MSETNLFNQENITAENVNSVLINLAEVVAMANDLVDQTPTNFGVVVELFNTSVEVAEVTEQVKTYTINLMIVLVHAWRGKANVAYN